MAEEVILTGEDLMTGPPSPVLPPELAPGVLDGVESCSESLKTLFHCLFVNDVEPFCQDQILHFKRCSQQRDAVLRKRLLEAEEALARALSPSAAAERAEGLKSAAELLERRLVLASAIGGMQGFEQRWRLNGELQDTRDRLRVLEVSAAAVPAPAPPPSAEAERSPWRWWRPWSPARAQ